MRIGRWGRVALVTAGGIVAGVFELVKTGVETLHRSFPANWSDFILTGLTVVATLVIIVDMRHRFHLLRHPKVLQKLANFGLLIGALSTVVLWLYGLWTSPQSFAPRRHSAFRLVERAAELFDEGVRHRQVRKTPAIMRLAFLQN